MIILTLLFLSPLHVSIYLLSVGGFVNMYIHIDIELQLKFIEFHD
jgi:hypothetical protein